MKRLLIILQLAWASSVWGYGKIDYQRLFEAIAQVESDDGKTSDNVYQITPVYVADIERITHKVFPTNGVCDRACSRRAMMVYWNYYGSRYEAKTGKQVTAEILAKMHRVGYVGLWRKKSTAANYWRRVRKHYEGKNK